MKYVKLLIILSIIGSLAFFLSAIDFKIVLTAVKQIGSKFIYLLLTTLIASILGTLSWRACMGSHAASVSIMHLFLIRHVGEIASIFNPAGIVGGEALKVHLLCNSRNLNRKTVLASILVSRAIMILTQLALFTFVALYLILPAVTLDNILPYKNALIIILVTLGVLLLFIFHRLNLKEWLLNLRIGKTLQHKTINIRSKLKELYTSMFGLYHANKKAVMYASIYAFLHWIVGAMEFYLILKFLGLNVSMFQAILVDMGVIFFKTAGVFIPAQAGIEEYGNKIMLAIIGISAPAIWITASILRRARQLFWLAFGIVVYLLMYKSQNQRLKELNGNIIR